MPNDNGTMYHRSRIGLNGNAGERTRFQTSSCHASASLRIESSRLYFIECSASVMAVIMKIHIHTAIGSQACWHYNRRRSTCMTIKGI